MPEVIAILLFVGLWASTVVVVCTFFGMASRLKRIEAMLQAGAEGAEG